MQEKYEMNKRICFIGYDLNSMFPTGVQRYTLEILNAMDRLVSPGEVELLITRDEDDCSFHNIRTVNLYDEKVKSSRIAQKLHSNGLAGRRLTTRLKNDRFLYKNWFLKEYVKKNDAIYVDLLQHFPNIGCDVIAIHDCIPEINMKEKLKRDQKHRKRRVENAIGKAKKIVTVSSTSRKEILKYYPTDKEITVIPNSWQHFERIKENNSIIERLHLQGKEFFFSVGSGFPHKNFRWISCAARENPDCIFVVSGRITSEVDISQDALLKNIIFTDYISDGEIKCLMRNCKAFIQPSLAEGFGIPPLEAMSVGADCILSNCSAFQEVYGQSVWYIDPVEYDDISMKEIMSKHKEGNDLILNKYSWNISAEKMLDVIRSLQDCTCMET